MVSQKDIDALIAHCQVLNQQIMALVKRVKALEEAVRDIRAVLPPVRMIPPRGTTGAPPPPRDPGPNVAPFPPGFEGD